MDIREKLIEILREPIFPHEMVDPIEAVADYLLDSGVTVQEWISVKDRLPDKDGQYLIFTTQYFTPDHIDEIDHRDGIEISGYYKGFGFLSTNGIYAKYWCCLPQPPKGE